MAKTIVIDTNIAKKLVVELERFEELKNHVLRLLPEEVVPYGSKLWWTKEILSGEADIKKKKYKMYTDAKDLILDLHKGL